MVAVPAVSPPGNVESSDGETDEASPDAPALFRRRMGSLVWRVGADLELGTVATATAALYFQRFFLVEKEGSFDAVRVAIACVWLSAKVNEMAVRLRDIVNSFLALQGQGQEGKAMQMEAYWTLRDELVSHEQAVLRAMTFDVEPTPAYAFLSEFARLVHCEPGERGLVALAWTLLNDAFCSDLCALTPAPRMAMASLLLAVEMGRRVPELRREAERVAGCVDALCCEPQMEDFLGLSAGAGGDELEEVCRDLLALYEVDRKHAGAGRVDTKGF